MTQVVPLVVPSVKKVGGGLSVADAMNKTDSIKYELELTTKVLLNTTNAQQDLKATLRGSLDKLVDSVLEDFSKVSVRRVNLDKSEHIDTTMYSGSPGLLYGLLKYVQLLKKEQKDG